MHYQTGDALREAGINTPRDYSRVKREQEQRELSDLPLFDTEQHKSEQTNLFEGE